MSSNGLFYPCEIIIKNPYNASYEYKTKIQDSVKNQILLIDDIKDDISLNFTGSPIKKDVFNLLYLGKILQNGENIFKLPNYTDEKNKFVFHFIFKKGASNIANHKKKIMEMKKTEKITKKKKKKYKNKNKTVEIPKHDHVDLGDVNAPTSNDKFSNSKRKNIPAQKNSSELFSDYYREYYQRQTQYYTKHGAYFDASLFTMNQYVQEAHQKSHQEKNSTQPEIRNRIIDQNINGITASDMEVSAVVAPQQNVAAAPAPAPAVAPVPAVAFPRQRRRRRTRSFCTTLFNYINTFFYRIAQVLILLGFGLQFYQDDALQVPLWCLLFVLIVHFFGVRFRRTENLSFMEKICRFFIGLIFSIYPDWNATLLRTTARNPPAAANGQ